MKRIFIILFMLFSYSLFSKELIFGQKQKYEFIEIYTSNDYDIKLDEESLNKHIENLYYKGYELYSFDVVQDSHYEKEFYIILHFKIRKNEIYRVENPNLM